MTAAEITDSLFNILHDQQKLIYKMLEVIEQNVAYDKEAKRLQSRIEEMEAP